MIIWGFGKKIRFSKRSVYDRDCSYCNEQLVWQTCIVVSWFTLFFIPIIPYKFEYRVECPNCKSYRKLTREEYNILKNYSFEDDVMEEA